jgi:hypothetical protein
MHPLLNSWQRIFTKSGFSVDLSQVNVPDRQLKENLPLVWPAEMTTEDVIRFFKASVENTLEFAAYIPGTMHDCEHIRDTRSGTYVHWVTSPIYNDAGQLASTYQPLDTRITLPELYLYHCWMIDLYGKDYAVVVGSGCEFCPGTTYLKKPDASPALEWDPQDIKVVLRPGFRDRANHTHIPLKTQILH